MSTPFHRIGLIGRAADPRVGDTMATLVAHLLARGRRVVVGEELGLSATPPSVERRPERELAAGLDLLVAIGGDGTLLHAAGLALDSGVPLLGVNRGRLGFLADVSPSELTERLDEVLAGQYERDERLLLEARLLEPGQPAVVGYALNDVVLQKHATGRMIEFETWIDGHFVNSHGGDGLIIATSTGSTGYALSCGGPILHPDLDAVVLAPICPHTLSDRPVVIGRDRRVEVRLLERSATRAKVIRDGVLLGELSFEGRLEVGPADRHVTLLHPPGHDYFRILRSKLHWGRSARNGEDA